MEMLTLFALTLLAAAQPEDRSSGERPGASSPDAGSGLRVVDRLVAVIDRQPLLLSQLDLEARVALIEQGGTRAVSAPLTDDDLARALDYAIGQRLAYAEAERLQVFSVEDDEAAELVRSFSRKLPGEAAYRELLRSQDASEAQIAAILKRNLRVARFIDSKVKLSARVSEEEVKKFWDTHTDDFAGQAFPQVSESIRGHLTRLRYEMLARQELERLRGRANVRILVSFRAGDGKAASP